MVGDKLVPIAATLATRALAREEHGRRARGAGSGSPQLQRAEPEMDYHDSGAAEQACRTIWHHNKAAPVFGTSKTDEMVPYCRGSGTVAHRGRRAVQGAMLE